MRRARGMRGVMVMEGRVKRKKIKCQSDSGYFN
jgi:hypothetical protein